MWINAWVIQLNTGGNLQEPKGSLVSHVRVEHLLPENLHLKPVILYSVGLIWTDLYADFKSITAINQLGWIIPRASSMV